MGLLDNLYVEKYNDKYDTAIEYLEESLYSKSYDTLGICENGLKYDVTYTMDDINDNRNECKIRYTSDIIESLSEFLEKGMQDNIKKNTFDIDYDVVQEDKKDEILKLKKLVNHAREFVLASDNEEYLNALELYSKYNLDGYLTEYLKKVVVNVEEDVLYKINDYIEEENIQIAEKIRELVKKYSSNKKLINEIDISIEGYKNYESLNKNYEEENYLYIIKFISTHPELKNHDKINSIYEDSVSKYIDNICDKVYELEEKKEYNQLNSILNDALKYVDSDKLVQLKEEYKLYNDNEIWYYPHIEGSRTQKSDELYVNNILFKKVFSIDSDNYLAIENKFKKVSGLLFIDQNNLDFTNEQNYSVDINIYGDRVLLKKITLNRDIKEVPFYCDNLVSYGTIKVEVTNAENIYTTYLTDFYGEK